MDRGYFGGCRGIRDVRVFWEIRLNALFSDEKGEGAFSLVDL